MTRDEIKFIDRLYSDLYLNDSVVKHTTSKDKYKRIKEYITYLEDIHNGVINHNHIDTLKKMYYDKYVIKEEDIPNSYYEHEQILALERGYGHIKYDEEEKKELNSIIINDQKKSLDVWLDYFLSEDSSYIPFWAKYWAFSGMLKLGSFDKEKGKYTKRSRHTVTKFADLNREALALSIDYLLKYLNKEEISDKELEGLVKNGSFGSIYTYIITKVLSNNTNITKRNKGIWIKYEQGTDHMPLVESLQGYNTGWCTAGESTARLQLSQGDFYVYYTLDDNDEYKVPRIAIRMEGDSIGEIRGIAENQNLEPEMEEVVALKIKDFPDKEEYYKKVRDMETLTRIYKNWQDEDLSKEELRFLYEIDYEIEGFGYEDDPRIGEILDFRDTKKDLAKIFDLSEDQIALSQDELTEDTVYCHGSLSFSETDAKDIKMPKIVNGLLEFHNLLIADGLKLPEKVNGSIYFYSLLDARGLKINEVNGAILFKKLRSAQGLELPQEMNGNLFFDSLESEEGLILPKIIHGGLCLDINIEVKNLILPEVVDDLVLYSPNSIEGITFPKQINGNLNLDNLRNSKNIILGELEVEMDLYLYSLSYCENLVLPKKVKKVWAMILSCAKRIVLPKEAEAVYLTDLTDFEEIIIPNSITY